MHELGHCLGANEGAFEDTRQTSISVGCAAFSDSSMNLSYARKFVRCDRCFLVVFGMSCGLTAPCACSTGSQLRSIQAAPGQETPCPMLISKRQGGSAGHLRTETTMSPPLKSSVEMTESETNLVTKKTRQCVGVKSAALYHMFPVDRRHCGLSVPYCLSIRKFHQMSIPMPGKALHNTV